MNRYQSALLSHFATRPDAVFCRQVGEKGETVLTWRDLEASCGAFAGAYRAAGLAEDDQALIFLRHVPELYGAFFGAMLSGLVPAFMPCSSPRQDRALYWRSHQDLLARIRPAAIVTDHATLAEMTAARLTLGDSRVLLIEDIGSSPLEPRFISETAAALLQHSSGTTGLKKGVALSFAAITGQIESYAAALNLNADDAIVSWLPLYHDMGLIACLILPAYFATPVTHIDPFHWIGRPDTLFERIVQDRGTLTWLPNFAFEHLAATVGRRAARWYLSSMRAFINCSEPCKAATFDRFAAAFAPAGVRADQLHCCYAMAETVFAVTQTEMGAAPRRITVDPATLDRGRQPVILHTPSPPTVIPHVVERSAAEMRDLGDWTGDTQRKQRAKSPRSRVYTPLRSVARGMTVSEGIELIETGRVIEGLEVSIHDETGGVLTGGEVGEIGVAGGCLFSGYNHDPAQTEERLRDGVYFSRDLGFIHDGGLYVLGRMDDLIIVNGRNLYAHEIEAQINTIAGLKPGRAVALAWFDPKIGSETLVIMAERAAASARSDVDIQRNIIDTIQSVFNVIPRAVELVDEGHLIKTTSGKISRKDNLVRFIAARAAATP